MTEAQKCLYYIAENMRMDKSISKEGYEYFQQAIKALEQEPKTGQWIDGKCNRCGTHAPFWAMASTYYLSEYCPHCGAKMEDRK